MVSSESGGGQDLLLRSRIGSPLSSFAVVRPEEVVCVIGGSIADGAAGRFSNFGKVDRLLGPLRVGGFSYSGTVHKDIGAV